MTLRGGTLRLTVLLAVGLLGSRVELASQVAPRALGRPWVLGPNGEPQDPKAGRERASRFQLYSDRDFARVFMTPGATLSGSSLFLCWENWPNNFGCPDGSYQRVRSDNLFTFAFLYGTHIYGVPATEWLEHRRAVPSLANARGRGYSVFNNTSAAHFINPKDGLVGVLHSGVTAEPDGTCRQTHGLFLGDPLMPLSNCPQTWGSLRWVGAQLVPEDDFAAKQVQDPASSVFDFWRVLGAYAAGALNSGRTLGSWQAYTVSSDWSIDDAALYGSVLPKGAGEPQITGWPLGLNIREDIWTYALPSLAGVVFVQALIINRSEDIYGVPLDYDSLYYGYSPSWWFHSSIQVAAQYWDPATGAFKAATTEEELGCRRARATQVTDITCPSVGTGIVGGSRHGAAAQVVLKSPIGDLRNKLLTRAGSRFYDPGHANAGDTITLQHGHMCGFRACTQTVWERWNDPDGQQRMFGMISSQEINVAGSRNLFDPVSLSDRDYWHTFRSEGFPERTGFKRYVPRAWDWNHDGRPDTLYLDSCGRGGCAVAWSDTLPGGFLNGYGNVGVVNTVGPFRLAAGDTAAYVMAFAVAPEGKDQLERMVKAIQDMYLNFFRGPSAAPVASISSVDVSTTALGRQLSLFLDDTEVTEWVDPFLMEQATALEGSRLAELNSDLLTKIRERARDNVEFVHLLKSCDGGSSFTNDFDCKGDPAEDGKFTDIGWLPYRTWPADDVPSVIEDREVTAGLTYTYVLVSETRGASFGVIEEDATGTLRAGRLDLAPKIMNPISVAAEAPQVARVYVPASFQAGSQRATAVLAAQSGAAKLAPEGFEQLSITPATDAPRSGAYRVLFADQVTVARTEIYETAALAKQLSVSTRIDARDKRTGRTILTSQVSGADGITVNGETRSERTVQGNLVFVTSTFDTLTALLVRGTNIPLLASSVLDGEKTTPGSFVGRSDFPGILLNVKHEPGGFEGSSYSLGGERLEPLTSPSVTWRSASARPGATARFGEYVFQWQSDAFGPGAPFVLDFNNPGAVAQAFAVSLSTRPVAQTTLAPSAAALALAKAAFLARGTRADSTAAGALGQSDIVQASLPFKIRNATFNADVSAIMLKRKSNVRRLGSGADTMTVAVPGDAWLPGDELILVENVGGSNAVAWATALLGCDPGSIFRPLNCNPVRGRGASLYVAATPEHTLSVRYFVGFSTQSQFTFDVRPAKVGSQITAEEVRAGLDQVNVVPNPYTGFSQIGEQIIFTHLPPRGRLRIYTVAGQFVQELSWGPADLAQERLGAASAGQGDLFFDLQTREGNRMASGLYLFVVTALSDDSRELGRKLGKFVIIR